VRRRPRSPSQPAAPLRLLHRRRLQDNPRPRPGARAGGNRMSELLPISVLNQWAYCPRRFWYMHVQEEMAENVHVVRGVLDHAHVHTPGDESAAPGVRHHRRLYVYSHRLGIGGFCDLVEEYADGRLAPVEYKE